MRAGKFARWFLATGIVCIAAAAALGWTPLAVVDDPLVRMPGTQPNQVTLEAPDRCLNCHANYNTQVEPGFNWRGSMMAQASRDFLFWSCMAVAAPVVSLMRNTVPDQRWGLASLSVPSKAGWGPGRSGGYLVRQFGVVHAPAGDLGVALAAEPKDGSFDSGIAALNQMTQWLSAHASELPGGRCAG